MTTIPSGPRVEHRLSDLEQRLRPSERMPVLFVGHGNPMHAIRENHYTHTWTAVSYTHLTLPTSDLV